MSVIYQQDGEVALITLDRPESLNAIDAGLAKSLLAALGRASTDAGAAVLTGAGKAFCSGADLPDLLDEYAKGDPDLDRIIGERFNPIIETLSDLPIPTVAAVNGAAAGAGMGMALACDLRIMADRAFLMSAFVHVGLVPDSGTTWLLPAMVGVSRATEIAMTGRRVTADEAVTLGLAISAVGQPELIGEAMGIARGLSVGPTDALVEARMLLRSSGLRTALAAERAAQGRLGKRHDHLEGIKAFTEKRDPEFTDSRGTE